MAIPDPDKILSDKLTNLMVQIATLQGGFYRRRPGCACDEKQLCSHHAAIHEHLSQATINLNRAIEQAESEN